MKTFVLIVSERFPATHPRAGQKTGFVDKIIRGEKIHTIRGNYELWKKRFEEIDKGNAIISIRIWTGKPYRSKQRQIITMGKLGGIGIQKLRGPGWPKFKKLAANDGLILDDFTDWFKDYDTSKPMALIHFSCFRY